MKKIILLLVIAVIANDLVAQTVQSDIGLMDYARIAQLQDSLNSPKQSFTIRSSSKYWSATLNDTFSIYSKPKIKLVQAGYTLQNNSDLPIGFNDGTLYPSIGMQQRFTIGIHAQWQHFSLHLQPEFVTAANEAPAAFQSDPADPNYIARYYTYIVNKIDNFSRFGTTPITKLFPGQSSFSYNADNISMGISTENLWWGPGIQNSLVLTNNAPGFLHFTVYSRKPIATKWGNMEFQAVIGSLQNASTEAPENEFMRTVWADGIAKKPNVQRTLLGYIFSWNPKWTPNLHIGLTGAHYFYSKQVTPIGTFLVLDEENKSGPASLGALFFRYAMPKEHAEVYIEYGRANRLANPFNIVGDAIPTGYTAGVRKLFKGGRGGILVSAEITQLQLPDARLIFNSENLYGIPRTNSWYTHPFITQGYTNQAQVLGASVGPGGNSETINISWVKGLKRIGFNVERLAHNNDFYLYNYFSGIVGTGTANKYWADINLAVQFQWDYKNILVSGFYNYTSALNYRWTKLDGGFAGPSTLSDRNNKQFSLSLTYFFNKKGS